MANADKKQNTTHTTANSIEQAQFSLHNQTPESQSIFFSEKKTNWFHLKRFSFVGDVIQFVDCWSTCLFAITE